MGGMRLCSALRQQVLSCLLEPVLREAAFLAEKEKVGARLRVPVVLERLELDAAHVVGDLHEAVLLDRRVLAGAHVLGEGVA